MKAVTIARERYYDSVFLMIITREVKALSGINGAVVSLATPSNVEDLARVGFTSPELEKAGPNDLVIAIDAENSKTLAAAQVHVEEMLRKKNEPSQGSVKERPRTLANAVKLLPEANLVLISVPGPYAAREARGALSRGFHVMLFSDNVPIDEEIALKAEAYERGLLMMGPDCGTALINGVPLGFANVVRRGPIGIVGASGTGIQEISSLVDRYGGGISQAIGTGGHDLSKRVGGVMTHLGIEALGDDDQTEVIVVVSKAPAQSVAKKVIDRLEKVEKPVVVQFIGEDDLPPHGNVTFAPSLAAAARIACEKAGVKIADESKESEAQIEEIAAAESAKISPQQQRLVGLFGGGTLAQEAWHLLSAGGEKVYSNVALDQEFKIRGDESVDGHVLVDLGDDIFTRGRPHPMIEPSLRDEYVYALLNDENIAILLVDLVLGYGAHPDPASGLAAAIAQVKKTFTKRGQYLSVVASITGTNADPQGYSRQRATLEDAGAIVMGSNEAVARLAHAILAHITREGGR
ncbi:acyl-CoA synthetase FdrA [Candidatus Bipolaricaulota bacterium]|nr:acyl-CoA synthetase FdrA [Candidatus Bipolaricaulota bacterium]